MKIVYPLLFQFNSLQTIASRKSYVSILPSFISGLGEVGFLNWVHQIFSKRRTSTFFHIAI